MSWTYEFTITRIHDGDTIEGVLDMGLGVYLGREPSPLFAIRFYGINAPELRTAEGKSALAYLQTLIAPEDVVTVISQSWDKYQGRIDGTPYRKDGLDLCQAMLDAGHAVPYPST